MRGDAGRAGVGDGHRDRVQVDRLPARELLDPAAVADLELAPLNPDLGQYFGATSGVLVINLPNESDLGFKGGDVVLSVDGRKPESPSHLLRILRSYGDTESYKAEVLRNRKRVTVDGRLGGRQ